MSLDFVEQRLSYRLRYTCFVIKLLTIFLFYRRDPFVDSETGSSFGFSETTCFTSETETGFANLVKPSLITVSLSKPKKDGGFHLVTCPGFVFFENIKVFTNHRISALPGTVCFTSRVA